MHVHFSLTCCSRFSYGSPRGLVVPIGEIGGGRERPPFFASWIGTAGQADGHWRTLAWGGGAPVPSIPGGKARNDTRGMAE